MNILNVILPIHIIIALSSVFYTLFVFFSPSQNRLRASYILIALTILTGSCLVAIMPAHLTQTCVEGLVYIAAMLAGIFAVKHKLANS